MSTDSEPLDDADLQQLEDLLGSDVFQGEAMTLDELQGFLCALLSGPVSVAPAKWLPVALGESPLYESEEQAKEIASLVMRFHNQIARALSGDETLDLVLYRPNESSECDYETWCRAYLEGVNFSPVAWEEAGDPGEIEELLFPIIILAGELSVQTRRRLHPEELAELYESCREDLAGVVLDVQRYWLSRRAKAADEGRGKAARSDPCPCGSGKRFKQCCGAPDRLH